MKPGRVRERKKEFFEKSKKERKINRDSGRKEGRMKGRKKGKGKGKDESVVRHRGGSVRAMKRGNDDG